MYLYPIDEYVALITKFGIDFEQFTKLET